MLYSTGIKDHWAGYDDGRNPTGLTLTYSERTSDGRRWACNMRWAVQNRHGVEIYRGPAWRARAIAQGYDRITYGEAVQAVERF